MSTEAFMFWLMKPLAEIAVGLAIFAVAALGYVLWQLPLYLRQRREARKKRAMVKGRG